jgi:hypothetical protein
MKGPSLVHSPFSFSQFSKAVISRGRNPYLAIT